jgi:peptide deformylase
VERLGTELLALIGDLHETMVAAKGADPRRPADRRQHLRAYIFGFEQSQRHPDAEPVPCHLFPNPVITPLAADKEDWEGCLSVPFAAWCRDSPCALCRI